MSNWKLKIYIFIHYFITFLGEHSNFNDVINVLQCLCSCLYVGPTGIRGVEVSRIFFLG